MTNCTLQVVPLETKIELSFLGTTNLTPESVEEIFLWLPDHCTVLDWCLSTDHACQPSNVFRLSLISSRSLFYMHYQAESLDQIISEVEDYTGFALKEKRVSTSQHETRVIINK